MRRLGAVVAVALLAARANAADQTRPGAGNAQAVEIARSSPLVSAAFHATQERARRIENGRCATPPWMRSTTRTRACSIAPACGRRLSSRARRRIALPAPSAAVRLRAGQLLPEYAIHNLSDADFIYSGPAVATAQLLLLKLASEFGYDPADAARYNVRYRNVALSRISAERIQELYAQGGLPAVAGRLHELRSVGAL